MYFLNKIYLCLQNQIEPKLCMFILEFLLALSNKESLFRHIDTFDLHYYIWENIPSFNESYSSVSIKIYFDFLFYLVYF